MILKELKKEVDGLREEEKAVKDVIGRELDRYEKRGGA